jgi:hypothetical protein
MVAQNVGVPVGMFPIADLTPNLPVGGGVQLTMDGNYAMYGSGSISTLVSMNDGSVVNLEVPYLGTPYRNFIPFIGWDGSTFCGVTSLKPSGSRPNFGVANWPSGTHSYDPRFSNLWPPTQGLIQDESISILTNTKGNNWTGVITNPTANLNPLQPHNLLGPLAYGASDSVSSGHGYEIETGGPAYEGPANYAVIGASVPGDEWGTVYYQPAYGVPVGSSSVYVLQEFTAESIPCKPDVGQLANPLCDTFEGFIAGSGGGTSYGLFNDAGPFRNYTFQAIRGGPRGTQCAVCGIDQGGTSVDKDGGFTDHTLSIGPVPYDVQMGRGGFYTPLFPPSFNLGGTTYSFGSSNGAIRAMAIIGQNIAAIVEYNLPVSSHILLAGGLDFFVTKFDTLNWKRSLTYGMQGPGIPGFFGDEPTTSPGAANDGASDSG